MLCQEYFESLLAANTCIIQSMIGESPRISTYLCSAKSLESLPLSHGAFGIYTCQELSFCHRAFEISTAKEHESRAFIVNNDVRIREQWFFCLPPYPPSIPGNYDCKCDTDTTMSCNSKLLSRTVVYDGTPDHFTVIERAFLCRLVHECLYGWHTLLILDRALSEGETTL